MKIILKDLDDISLLEGFTKTRDEELYNEFVKRYYSKVKDECIKKCKMRKIDVHIGEQIAHETFEKVKNTKTFKSEKLNSGDPKNAIKGWLYRISTNLFYDYHNSIEKKSEISVSYFDELASEVERNPKKLLSKKELAKLVFSKLNVKEKEVVLTDIEYKRGMKYLPHDILESLAERINVKKDTVRKIRERAILKIKLAINEINV